MSEKIARKVANGIAGLDDVLREIEGFFAAHREVASPDGRRWTSESGGIGLGTSGSGDVLAGVVGGLLARGCTPEQAAVWGQYVHAAAGDRLATHVGRTGFLARAVLEVDRRLAEAQPVEHELVPSDCACDIAALKASCTAVGRVPPSDASLVPPPLERPLAASRLSMSTAIASLRRPSCAFRCARLASA